MAGATRVMRPASRTYPLARARRVAVFAALACVLASSALAVSGCVVNEERPMALRQKASEVANDPTMAGKPVEVEGRVLPGSWNGSARGAYFQIADADWSGGRGLEIRASNRVPEGFREEAYVVVRGTVGNDLVIDAESVSLSAHRPAAAEFHAGDSTEVRGLTIALASVAATAPSGMAPALVTAPVPRGRGTAPLYTLLRVTNTTDATQPVVWRERATLLDAKGAEYPVIGAAFTTVRGGSGASAAADEQGFVDPSTHAADRSENEVETLGPRGEASILTVFSVPKGAEDLRLQWNPGGAPVEFQVP